MGVGVVAGVGSVPSVKHTMTVEGPLEALDIMELRMTSAEIISRHCRVTSSAPPSSRTAPEVKN